MNFEARNILSMQQLKEQIRALIMQNETDAAVDTLLEWSKSNYLSIYDQCVLLRARLEQIEREANTNLIAPEDAMRQVNQVNAALLNLISDLETKPVEQVALKTHPTKSNSWLVTTLLGALILAIGVATYFFLKMPANSAATSTASTTDGILSGGQVRFPDGKRVVLVENGQDVAYEILSAKVESLNPQQRRLALQVRCLPKMAYAQDINFWNRDFRLECPGLPPLPPSNDLNLIAESGSYKDGPVEFLIPPQARSGKLTIQFGSQSAQLSMAW